MDNWYYVGNYGQLGPLNRSDIDDLIICGAITRETFVWREGMSDWQTAGNVGELESTFPSPPSRAGMEVGPPPTPITVPITPPVKHYDAPIYRAGRSRKSRVLGGILNLLLPGVGRLYLAYTGIGVAQLLTFLLCGIGWVWSFIDGIMILADDRMRDGEGNLLKE